MPGLVAGVKAHVVPSVKHYSSTSTTSLHALFQVHLLYVHTAQKANRSIRMSDGIVLFTARA